MDVKAVIGSYDPLSESELILSASRDETAACWSRPCPSTGEPTSGPFLKGSVYHGQRYANSVAYVKPCPTLPRGQVLLGSLDSQIRCFDPLRPDRPVQILSEHWDNISVITVPDVDGKLTELSPDPCFISGSWDRSARVWSFSSSDPILAAQWRCIYALRAHEQAVWGVAIVEPPTRTATSGDLQGGRYLTSSADLFVRLFYGDQLHAVYAGHTDVVRSIVLLPPASDRLDELAGKPPLFPSEQLFATASNDGTVRLWSLDARRSPTNGNGGEALRTLKGHESLVYSLAVLPFVDTEQKSSRLVSSGEDGTVRVWDWNTERLVTTLPQPAISVWSVGVLPKSGDIVAGLSDGTVRVYTQLPVNATESTTSSSPGCLVSFRELEEHCSLCQSVTARLEEKARSTSESASTEAHTNKELFDSKRYDAVLRIDVSDDCEPLPLPINAGNDRRVVAQRFVEQHNLPASYLDEIINFLALVFPASTQTACAQGDAVKSSPIESDVVTRGTQPEKATDRLEVEETHQRHPSTRELDQYAPPTDLTAELVDFHKTHFQDTQRATFASQMHFDLMPIGFDVAQRLESQPSMQERRDVFRRLQQAPQTAEQTSDDAQARWETLVPRDKDGSNQDDAES